MDGVLVDSWEPHLRSWRALAAENGLPFQAGWFPAAFGKKSREIIASWWPGRAGDAESLDARKEQLYREEIGRRFPPGPSLPFASAAAMTACAMRSSCCRSGSRTRA